MMKRKKEKKKEGSLWVTSVKEELGLWEIGDWISLGEVPSQRLESFHRVDCPIVSPRCHSII